jgi:hypothetical protein
VTIVLADKQVLHTHDNTCVVVRNTGLLFMPEIEKGKEQPKLIEIPYARISHIEP